MWNLELQFPLFLQAVCQFWAIYSTWTIGNRWVQLFSHLLGAARYVGGNGSGPVLLRSQEKHSAASNTGSGEDLSEAVLWLKRWLFCKRECPAKAYHNLTSPITRRLIPPRFPHWRRFALPHSPHYHRFTNHAVLATIPYAYSFIWLSISLFFPSLLIRGILLISHCFSQLSPLFRDSGTCPLST